MASKDSTRYKFYADIVAASRKKMNDLLGGYQQPPHDIGTCDYAGNIIGLSNIALENNYQNVKSDNLSTDAAARNIDAQFMEMIQAGIKLSPNTGPCSSIGKSALLASFKSLAEYEVARNKTTWITTQKTHYTETTITKQYFTTRFLKL